VPEDILEGQAIGLPVAREVGRKSFSQQFAALLEDEFELLHAGRAQNVVGHFGRIGILELSQCVLERAKTAPEERCVCRCGHIER